MKWRKGWAIVDMLNDPRNSKSLWSSFEVYRARWHTGPYLGAGEKLIRVEYRFPKAKKRNG